MSTERTQGQLWEEEKSLYKKCIEKWGTAVQLGILQEECAELIVAVSKLNRKGESKQTQEGLVEELVDVEIMVSQVKECLDAAFGQRFQNMKEYKLKRLADRLEELE